MNFGAKTVQIFAKNGGTTRDLVSYPVEEVLVVLPLLVVARLLLERLRDVARFAWPLVVVVVVPIIFNKFIEINLLK